MSRDTFDGPEFATSVYNVLREYSVYYVAITVYAVLEQDGHTVYVDIAHSLLHTHTHTHTHNKWYIHVHVHIVLCSAVLKVEGDADILSVVADLLLDSHDKFSVEVAAVSVGKLYTT